jgi:hypothetical protein
MRGIEKRFDAPIALDGVDFAVAPVKCAAWSERTAPARAR